MRKVALVITALLVLLVVSFVSPLGAVASTRGPGTPGPHSGARSSPSRALAFSSPRVSTASSRPSISTASPIACDGTFDLVTSPNGTGHNDIFATSVVSANDVWAVGAQTNSGGYDQTLAEHWNGTAWSIVATPNPGSTHNDLNGVAAFSTNDVWVVGDYFDSLMGAWLEFTSHWNGSGWSAPTILNYGFLFGVAAVASNNVWAVGTTYFSPFDTVIYHWDGSNWNVVASPNPAGFDNELFFVSAFSSTDIWAVGQQEATSGSPVQSLAEHWDGSFWTWVVTPNDTGDNVIAAVAALEGGHAVGVGFAGISAAHGEAWNLLSGGGSSNTALAGPGSGDNILEGVALSGASVWAVGFWRATTSSARQTMAWPATWNSSSHTLTWGSVGTSASPATTNNVLFAVAAVSPNVFWATGYMNNGGFDQSLMESYCAVHFGITAPASTFTGAAFSLTVTAKNSNGTTDTAYRGTVHFTSTDAGAVLPGNYTFTSLDAGTHTFTGVVLKTPYNQTITASDTITPFVTGSVVVMVLCLGACPAPPGTPGTRGTNSVPIGTPGSRGANQSGAGAPGPRLPRLGPLAQNGDSAPGVGLAAATGPAPTAGGAAPPVVSTQLRSAPRTSRADGTGPSSTSVPASTHYALSLVARSERVSPPPDQTPWYVLLLIPLLVCPLALIELRRSKFKEKSNARTRP